MSIPQAADDRRMEQRLQDIERRIELQRLWMIQLHLIIAVTCITLGVIIGACFQYTN